MQSKNIITSIFITDNNIGIFVSNQINDNKSVHAEVSLDADIIQFGYIKEPEKLYNALKKAFKQIKVKPKSINMVIQDENVLIREIDIDKEVLKNSSVDMYINKQIGKTLHFPFEEIAYSYHILEDNEETVKIVIFIADKNLIEDYLDVFDKLKIKTSYFNIIASSINAIFNDSKDDLTDNSMVVTIFDKNITINIIENKMTIFGMTDECEEELNVTCQNIEDYIERIANYYQYNMRKGSKKIKNVFLLDLSNSVSNEFMAKKKEFSNNSGLNIVNLNIGEMFKNVQDVPKTVEIAYLSAITSQKENSHEIEFKIYRPKRGLIITNYLLVFSIAIFAFIALIYMPFANGKEEIFKQEALNEALLIQKQMLEDNIISNNSFTSYERAYNEAFVYLDSQITQKIEYLTDLIELMDENIVLNRVEFDTQEQMITFVISSDLEVNLYEYIISIYEEYGMIPNIENNNKWITRYPESSSIGNLVMKVVVYYA